MSDALHIAVLGATGLVGRTMLSLLADSNLPIAQIYPLASARSAGQAITFRGQAHTVLDASVFDFAQANLALFSAGSDAASMYAPEAVAKGCVVIDNSSCFRYDDSVPLIVPEVNGRLVSTHDAYDPFRRSGGIIANPNCSTIQMVLALKPIHDAVRWTRINVATYQAVSGAGQLAVDQLKNESRMLLDGEGASLGSDSVAFNVIPRIDQWQQNGYSREEMKIVWETRKILDDHRLAVNPTAVRVPVINGHAMAIHGETRDPISADEAITLLKQAPGVVCMVNQAYPTPRVDADGADRVFVGRVRSDISHPNGLNLWVVGDNLRKGAALNAVQIAERLIQ